MKMSNISFHYRHFLSLTIFVCVLAMGLRFADMWGAVSSGRVFEAVTPSMAEEKGLPAINPPSLSSPQQKAEFQTAAGETPGIKPASPPAAISVQPEIKNLPTGSAIDDASGAEMALIKQLTQRRDQLEQRSQMLDSREAMLKVAEQRVDQKIKEMEILRAQLQTMVNQLSAQQQEQVENLVKIYETMKPKDAARILEELELPVLLGVVRRMKPQRTAAVMAEMRPEKAKEITMALSRQDQLPQIK